MYMYIYIYTNERIASYHCHEKCMHLRYEMQRLTFLLFNAIFFYCVVESHDLCSARIFIRSTHIASLGSGSKIQPLNRGKRRIRWTGTLAKSGAKRIRVFGIRRDFLFLGYPMYIVFLECPIKKFQNSPFCPGVLFCPALP